MLECIEENVFYPFLEEAEKTAQKVYDSSMAMQEQVILLMGPYHEFGPKHVPESSEYPEWEGSLSQDQYMYHIGSERSVHVYPGNSKYSFVFSGLDHNRVFVHDKINHLVVRKSKFVEFHLWMGTVSGIDLMYVKHFSLYSPYYNFLSLSFGDQVHLDGTFDDASHLKILGSWDIHLNQTKLLLSPFDTLLFPVPSSPSDGNSLLPTITWLN